MFALSIILLDFHLPLWNFTHEYFFMMNSDEWFFPAQMQSWVFIFVRMRWGEERGAEDGTYVVVDIWRRPHLLPFLPHNRTLTLPSSSTLPSYTLKMPTSLLLYLYIYTSVVPTFPWSYSQVGWDTLGRELAQKMYKMWLSKSNHSCSKGRNQPWLTRKQLKVRQTIWAWYAFRGTIS